LLLLESLFRFGSQPAYPGLCTVRKFRVIVIFPNGVGAREDLHKSASSQFASRKIGQERASLAGAYGAIDFLNEVFR
jgi:hypothetical protein